MFTIEFCDKIVFTSFSVHSRVLGAFFNNAHFHVICILFGYEAPPPLKKKGKILRKKEEHFW